MTNDEIEFLLLIATLAALALSCWMIVLFLHLCKDVRCIKTILMTACDLEEYRGYKGAAYRRKQSASLRTDDNRCANFVEPQTFDNAQ